MRQMTTLLLLLWVAVTVITALDLQKRIIGGHDCRPNERLYHVKLSDDPAGNRLMCGGSLIDQNWILTAAHCVGTVMYAVLGVHGGTRRVVQITAPPRIYRDSQNRDHDIMLLRLPSPVTNIPTIQLPDCLTRPQIGNLVNVAGYGRTAPGTMIGERESGPLPTVLQCVDIEVVDCTRLEMIKLFTVPARLYQHWFCGQTPHVDTCGGDSGGGVVFNNRIYGVHCFTGDTANACTEAAGFMDVCEYLNWITNTITTP